MALVCGVWRCFLGVVGQWGVGCGHWVCLCALRCNKLIATSSQTALLFTHYAILKRKKKEQLHEATKEHHHQQLQKQKQSKSITTTSKLEAEQQHVGMSIILYKSTFRGRRCTWNNKRYFCTPRMGYMFQKLKIERMFLRNKRTGGHTGGQRRVKDRADYLASTFKYLRLPSNLAVKNNKN